jgi:hypothetical protein
MIAEDAPPPNNDTNDVDGINNASTQFTAETIDDAPHKTAGVDKDEAAGVGEEDNTSKMNMRTYQVPADQFGLGTRMNLRQQPRKRYDIFNIDGEEGAEGIMLLQYSPESEFEIDEQTLDMVEVEWIFPTEGLGWKEGLIGIGDGKGTESHKCKQHNEVPGEYVFLPEQMGWQKGLKIFEKRGEMAIEQELRQIHDMEGFQPKHWHELTEKERASALKYFMYLKEKKDGSMKGHGCADRRPQRVSTSKNECSSPTTSLAGLIMTCLIDAYKRRDVATLDIPGAFLQTRMPNGKKGSCGVGGPNS